MCPVSHQRQGSGKRISHTGPCHRIVLYPSVDSVCYIFSNFVGQHGKLFLRLYTTVTAENLLGHILQIWFRVMVGVLFALFVRQFVIALAAPHFLHVRISVRISSPQRLCSYVTISSGCLQEVAFSVEEYKGEV